MIIMSNNVPNVVPGTVTNTLGNTRHSASRARPIRLKICTAGNHATQGISLIKYTDFK